MPPFGSGLNCVVESLISRTDSDGGYPSDIDQRPRTHERAEPSRSHGKTADQPGVPNRDQRKILVVHQRLQHRIVADLGLVPILVLIVGAIVLGILIGDLNHEAHERAVQLRAVTPLVCGLVGFILVTSFVLLTQALRISNRVAGPQVRVRQVIDDVLAGNTAMRVQIRARDYLHDAADDINRLIVHIDNLRRASAQPMPAESNSPAGEAPHAAALLDAQPSPFADNTPVQR